MTLTQTLSTSELHSLHRHLQRVPDPRGARGRRYPLPTVLTIILAARLAGQHTLTKISDFGRALSQETLRTIGAHLSPTTGRYQAPGISTLHYIVKQLDPARIEEELNAWLGAQAPPGEPVAVDGKTLRGSYDRDLDENGQPRDEPPQQHVAAVGIDSRQVLTQIGCTGKKEDAEGAAMRRIVTDLAPGTWVFVDALHTLHRNAEHLRALGLEYVFTVKANQPTLLAWLERYHFEEAPQQVEDHDLTSGRIEHRRLQMAELKDYEARALGFPHAVSIARVERHVTCKKDGRERAPETVYLITSLSTAQVNAQRLLALNRGYWGAVENGLHRVKDHHGGEDKLRYRKGALPRVMAAFYNVAITILRMLGQKNIARAMNNLVLRADQTVALLVA